MNCSSWVICRCRTFLGGEPEDVRIPPNLPKLELRLDRKGLRLRSLSLLSEVAWVQHNLKELVRLYHHWSRLFPDSQTQPYC